MALITIVTATGQSEDSPSPAPTVTVTETGTSEPVPGVVTETVTEEPVDEQLDSEEGTATQSEAVQPSEDVYYENCDAARAAGAAPVYAGEPGYGPHLDRDGDGVACEP
ncbi:excalibur calcium-binding domain-containing protein [Streptomyces sp. ATCC 21386]|uniref:excalibur calcium-binding domain-containing protein n=1 Tax=Streptomyces sp. ATCC 21386 TaxID=2699428 RepID=UPI002044E6AB|nr:excalibur calcium-binding domain-containing protein [Streptomyces sp. ATCC 21386]